MVIFSLMTYLHSYVLILRIFSFEMEKRRFD